MKKEMIIGFFIFLLLIPLGVFSLANLTTTKKPITVAVKPSPALTPTLEKTQLSFLPNPLLTTTKTGSVEVTIDTKNAATGVQLELAYDPKIITAMDITPGSFFTNPLVLLKNIDTEKGRISWAIAIPPNLEPVTGKGTLATITFTSTLQTPGETTTLLFLPETIVTAVGATTSVLGTTNNLTITYGDAVDTGTTLPVQ